MQLFEIEYCLLRVAHIRVRDDLQQRSSRTIQIHLGNLSFMYIFPCIRFKVCTGNPDRPGAAIFKIDMKFTLSYDRNVKLGDLICHRAIGVEVTFSVENRSFIHNCTDSITERHCLIDCFEIEYRQSTRQCQAGRAGVGVLMRRETGRARTEYFCLCVELDMDFQTDNRFKHQINL